MFDRSLKVLLISPEVSPLAKVGGLADVAGSLPKALATLGQGEISHDIRVALPRYKGIDAREYVTDFPVQMDGRQETAVIRRTQFEAHLGVAQAVVPVYLVDNYHYFNREGIYAHGDDADRFIFFSKAVLEMLPRLNFQPDILHLNDWQTGAVALLLEARHRKNPFYERMATVFTIHNLQYQGNFDRSILRKLGLGEEYFHPEGIEFYGQVSLLKAGLVYAQVLNTVSPTYAQEIKTPAFGERLDGLLRRRASDLFGVLNGINYHEFNPTSDPRIAHNYSSETIGRKKDNKRALQEELGLAISDAPLVGVVSRLVSQKGLDLISDASQEIKTPAFGERLDGLLRRRASDLFGVLNGINYHEFNPKIG
ncbi:MAG: glycogen/starch synthase, partial [Firmicutes bacterium]|nr:glycogen/starch synthase [Bacillota bacterium]